MKEKRFIVDTTLRDGEQSPGIALNMEQKVRIAQILDESGIYQIEAGTPAMGRYEMETIGEIMRRRQNAKVSVWCRSMAEDIEKAIACTPDIIHISVPSSYALIYSKLNKNKGWVVKNLLNCIDLALCKGFEVTVGLEDASRADITFLAALALQIKNAGVRRIRYADTVGIVSPSRIEQSVHDLADFAEVEIELHAHNDLGMATANTIAGAKAGALYLDTTICGLGERAGNCDYTQLVYAADRHFDFGISKFDAFCVAERVCDVLSLAPQHE